jgi:Flp pilus assembly protein TadD
MAQALRAQPGHAAASSNLAALLRLTGRYDAAEKLLREALAGNPHDAGARRHLKPLIDELERAGALNDWREGERAPITATNSSDPAASSERSAQ